MKTLQYSVTKLPDHESITDTEWNRTSLHDMTSPTIYATRVQHTVRDMMDEATLETLKTALADLAEAGEESVAEVTCQTTNRVMKITGDKSKRTNRDPYLLMG